MILSPSLAPNAARRAVLLGFAALVAAGASGCGRRGQLEPPPDPSAVKPAEDPLHPQIRHAVPPIEPPKQAFILDPLL